MSGLSAHTNSYNGKYPPKAFSVSRSASYGSLLRVAIALSLIALMALAAGRRWASGRTASSVSPAGSPLPAFVADTRTHPARALRLPPQDAGSQGKTAPVERWEDRLRAACALPTTAEPRGWTLTEVVFKDPEGVLRSAPLPVVSQKGRLYGRSASLNAAGYRVLCFPQENVAVLQRGFEPVAVVMRADDQRVWIFSQRGMRVARVSAEPLLMEGELYLSLRQVLALLEVDARDASEGGAVRWTLPQGAKATVKDPLRVVVHLDRPYQEVFGSVPPSQLFQPKAAEERASHGR